MTRLSLPLKKISSQVKSRLIWMVILLSCFSAAISYQISYSGFKRNIQLIMNEEAEAVEESVQFIYKRDGAGTVQQYMESIQQSKKEINLILFYDIPTDRVIASTESSWVGLPLGKIPQAFVGEDVKQAMATKEEHTGVRKHQGEFDLTTIRNQTVFMIHLSNKEYFQRFFVSSFFNEFLTILVLVFLILFPLILFFRQFLSPFRETLTNTVKQSPIFLYRFREEYTPSQGKKLGIFSFAKQFEEDIEKILVHEQWMNSLLDQQPIGLMFSNRKGEVVAINQKMSEIIGVISDEAMGDQWTDLLHPEEREKTIGEWRRVIDEQSEGEFQTRFRTPDGLINWVYCKALPIRDPSNEILGILGVFVVINKQKRMEKNAGKEHGHLARLLDAANMGYWDWNIETGEVNYSKIWKSMLGYSEEEVEPQFSSWEALVHPEDLAQAKKHIEDSLLKGKPYHMQFRMKTKEGKWAWILSYGNVVENSPEGKPLKAMGIHLDVTDQMEESARINHLETAVDSPSMIHFSLDLEGKILIWAKGAEEIYGLKQEEAIGKSITEVLGQKSQEAINTAKESEMNVQYMTTYQTADQKQRQITFTIHKVRDEKGRLTGYSWVGRDVSSEHTLSEKKVALDQEKSNLITIVSHQLRTPLSVIQQSIEILDQIAHQQKEGEGEGEFLEYLGICRNNTNRIIEMIHDTLDYEELEFNLKEWNFQSQSLKSIAEDTLYRLRKGFEEKGVLLKTEFSDSLPSVSVDAESMKKAMTNFISNALHFTEEGEVVIRLRQEGDEVIFEVQDTGIGIREEDFPTLFTMFAQIHSSNLRFGSGLGLVIAKKIAECHGGKVSYESKFGKGSTFRFHIPIKEKKSG